MKALALRWQLLIPNLFLLSLSLIAVTLIATFFFRSASHEQTYRSLNTQAHLIRDHLSTVDSFSPAQLQTKFNTLGKNIDTRVTLIAKDGTVIADSFQSPDLMENHADRPEIQQARSSGFGQSRRYSKTEEKNYYYVALRYPQTGPTWGFIRTSISESQVYEKQKWFYLELGFSCIIIILFFSGVSVFISKQITAPILGLQQVAKEYAQGHFDVVHPKPKTIEMRDLADSLSHMAKQLKQKMNATLKMEKMRKEFVGNVSHELRTPITLIKGFVETLKDGAKDIPEERDRFLNIIHHHANRLNAIIEDLLILSRIEQENQDQLDVHSADVSELINRVMFSCQPKADRKHISFVREGVLSGTILVNAPLLEQALINLVDNAIKFSPENGKITIRFIQTSEHIRFEVSDQGQGIEKEHHKHLFERFYRIDKARSRKLGGTGLGLAIVKHIVQAHKGKVGVISDIGKGSTFVITLPHKLSLYEKKAQSVLTVSEEAR